VSLCHTKGRAIAALKFATGLLEPQATNSHGGDATQVRHSAPPGSRPHRPLWAAAHSPAHSQRFVSTARLRVCLHCFEQGSGLVAFW
jgi:hypothetical protein